MSSKRGSVFDQGRPEDPFPERDEVEPVRKATAAQMATRKIKAAKGRRAPGVSSGLSQSMMQPSQPSSFGFGGGDNNNNNSGASSFGFGSQQTQSGQGTSMFGGGATNSFPPTQSSAPSNSFSSSSFPAFGGGGDSANTAFSPQPPSTGFNFTAGASNPFAASAPSTATNGSSSGGFSGSIFNTGAQSTSTPFAGFGGNNNTSSAAPSNSMFGTSAPQTNMFGNTVSSAESSGSATLATSANPFGGLSATTPSTPATPFNFGSTQPASTPTQDSTPASKSFFSSVQPASTAPKEATPASKPAPFGTSFTPAPISSNSDAPSTPFSIFGAKTQGESTSTPAASTNLFSNFGAPSQSGSANTPAATPSLFPAMKQEGASNGAMAGNNLFGGFGNSQGATASTPASTPSLFGTVSKGDVSSTPAAGSTATPAPITSQSEATTTSTPAPSLFKSFGPASTTSKPETSGTSLFSASTPGNVFGGFNKTPATTTPSASNDTPSGQEASTPAFGINKTASPANIPGSGSGLFSQSHQPKAPESTPFAFQQPSTSKTPSLFSQSQPANPKESNSPASFATFNKPTPSPSQPASQQNAPVNMFSAPSSTEQQSAPPFKMPNLTEAAAPPPEIANMPEKPRIGTIHLPASWGITDGSDDTLKGLAIQVATLNHRYRERLSNVPLTANWSALSRFHLKATEELSAKIAAFRKREAAAKGITGHESSLSVKRKATTEEGHDNFEQDATPSKKPRAAEAPSTPTPKGPTLPTTTPKASPPVSNTSSLFGSVLSKSANSTAANAEKTSETSKSTTSQAGFSFLSNGAKPAASSSPFQMPSSGSTGKGSVFGSGGGGLLGQFSSKAKSYEQLVAERKAKEKEEDYDSDEESEEQWSARWDKKEAERVAKEKENSAPPVQASTAPPSSNSSGLNLLAGFSKPTSGASTPGLFGSRTGSPAPSMGGKSVFDTPDAARSPASNPFAHLSSGQSSNSQDDDDDDEDAEDQGVNGQSAVSAQPLTRKRKVFDDSESESGEFAGDSSTRSKVGTAKKPTLADRITKDASVAKDDDSEKENGDPNGTQTPSKPFSFFDFGKAAQSAPPKSDKFAGDQTFKVGTPIKFGSSVKDAPTFQFQPATPAPGDLSATPSKPPPASTFSFLNAGPSSTPGSVFSSRAATPMSEAEASGKESAADNDDEDGEKHAQVDLSDLTEEEKAENAVLFHTEQALCKHQADKQWANYARGRLWILKNNKTGKAIVRMRLSSGNTMLNYNILPKLKTSITGSTGKMVSAIGTKKDGKTGNLIFAVKNDEIAAEFSKVYNEYAV